MTEIQRPIATPAPYDRNIDTFSGMVEESVEVLGYELVKDDKADELVGIPFLITHVTFRPGMMDPKDKGRRLAYVSCECVLADEEFLAKRKISLDDKPFVPSEHIVVNDGSTGIYRQVLAVLESQGYIGLPDGPVGGAKGETRYDLPPSEWEDIRVGEAVMGEVGTDSEGFLSYSAPVRIFAPRGLRLSEYSNAYTQDGKTRYLA